MSAPADPHSHGNPDVRFEPTDVSTRPVVVSVAALAVFTLVFTFVAHLVFHGLAAREKAASAPANPLAAEYAATQPPEPRLQLHPKTDLEVLHAAEDKILNNYAWVDKNAGIAQVPIERAMELLLAKGMPARQGSAVPAKMMPKGDAPAQMAEGAGAPDWHGSAGIGHDGGFHEEGHEAAAASGEAAPEAHGH
jgi:hypothetical protein